MATATADEMTRIPTRSVAKPTSSPAKFSTGTMKMVMKTTAALVTHFSCSRSTPWERRKRTTRAATEAKAPTAIRMNPTTPATSAAGPMPNGLSTG